VLKWLDGFTRAEWRVLNISFVMMTACALLLSNERLMRRLMPRTFSSGQVLGQALDVSGDARVKSKEEKWRALEGPLQLGDTVATGKDGRALVKIKPGVEFQFTPNSVLRVALVEGVPVFDLLDGRFIWTVTGEMEVAVRGERAQLHGDPATIDIQLAADSVEPRVKIGAGRGTFQLRHKRNEESELQAPIAAPMPNQTYFYVWRLHDLYNVSGRKVEPKPAPLLVPIDIILNWEHPVAAGPFSVQLSAAPEFTEQSRFFPSGDQTLTLEQAFLGENYWRVSFRDMYWSESRTFKVEPRFWDIAFKAKESASAWTWTASEKAVGYLIEGSSREDFSADLTLEWSGEPMVQRLSVRDGVNFLRIRAVSSRNEISDWSRPVKFGRTEAPRE
jgi:hypothetical protein